MSTAPSELFKKALELTQQTKFADAQLALEQHLTLEPNDAAAHNLMGHILAARCQREARPELAPLAADHARRAVECDPDSPLLLKNLIIILRAGLRRVKEALALAEHGHQRWPADFAALLSVCQVENLRADQACETVRLALQAAPDQFELASSLCGHSNYHAGLSPAQRFEIHRFFGSILDRRPQPAPNFTVSKDPARKLRVGFISPDFREHSCAHFLRPIFEHLDRAQFELFAYYTYTNEDATTKWFKSKCRFNSMPGNAPLGFRIWGDRIDILIDLAGHTEGGRLNLFHSRPAPVQVTYLGYPNTTGLTAMQHRIVDTHTDPPGADAFATEHLARLDPCFLCYAPPPEAPTPAATPGRPLTFGSFNNATKFNASTAALFARAVSAVPGSRLVLKNPALGEPDFQAIVRELFTAAGLASERLVLMPGDPATAAHLARYNDIDIGLDTIPYNGTTTTCEALWMGVPVVTLAGDWHAARVGCSLLAAVGLPDLVAQTPEQFAAVAAALAADAPRRAALRTGLRSTMAASPLCDGPGFAARFGGLLRGLWTAYAAAR